MSTKKFEKRGLLQQRMDTLDEVDAPATMDDEENGISEKQPMPPQQKIRKLSRSQQQAQQQQQQPQVVETESGPAVRLPIEYGSINMAFEYSARDLGRSGRSRAVSDASCRGVSMDAELARTSAAISRYKYYSRIAPGASSRFIMPAHVVPPRFLLFLPFKTAGQNQSSIITVFNIWNTMMGTSMLSMPWAVKESGFATSFVVLVVMTCLTCYTAYRVLDSYNKLLKKGIRVSEFSDVCKHYMGRSGEVSAVFFSAMALLGGVIVYWVLLSNFLYQSGQFIYSYTTGQHEDSTSPASHYTLRNRTYDVVCPLYDLGEAGNQSELDPTVPELLGNVTHTRTLFSRLWSKTDTVPFYVLLLAWPLISIKSPSFFSKFNALGTVAAGYLLLFVLAKAFDWGLHLDFAGEQPELRIQQFSPKFSSYTGILSVALFCHCFLILLVKPAKNPKNNPRDLITAYACVCLTYLVIGAVFYSAYPLAKSCIEQNFLDNIPSNDVLAFTARIFLLLQMLSVFPLLVYIMRAQLLYYFFRSVYPSWLHVLIFHAITLTISILVAHFYPNIGNILRFSGAICGLAYIFTLPTAVYLIAERQANRLTVLKCIAHFGLIAVGLANFVAQFLF